MGVCVPRRITYFDHLEEHPCSKKQAEVSLPVRQLKSTESLRLISTERSSQFVDLSSSPDRKFHRRQWSKCAVRRMRLWTFNSSQIPLGFPINYLVHSEISTVTFEISVLETFSLIMSLYCFPVYLHVA